MAVPMRILCGRPFVDLVVKGPSGSATACTWVDTGGGGFVLAGDLADSIGVKWELQENTSGGAYGTVAEPPRVTNLPLEPLPGRTAVKPGPLFDSGYPATAFMPGHLMLGRDVLFDYPGGQFDVAMAGDMSTAGENLPAPRSQQMGFPRIEVEIDGERLGFLLDTGASYTMISDAVISRWLGKHPDWPWTFGATRNASMGNTAIDLQRVIRVPEVRWGSAVLSGVGMVARPEGTFENYMTEMMTAPIVGAIAGNVLSCFRFQLGEDVVFADQQRAVDNRDLDGVGLALSVDKTGRFTVLAVCEAADESVSRQVEAGDELVAVDGQETTGALIHDVSAGLAGPPGETRSLAIKRGSREMTVEVRTAAIL